MLYRIERGGWSEYGDRKKAEAARKKGARIILEREDGTESLAATNEDGWLVEDSAPEKPIILQVLEILLGVEAGLDAREDSYNEMLLAKANETRREIQRRGK